MTGFYKLNGSDIYSAFGMVISEGSNPILQQRKVKDRFFNDWPEENGLEYDLTAVPKFHDRTFRIKAAIIANSEADFNTKYNALFTALTVAGAVSFESLELSKTVYVMYSDMPLVERLTRIKMASKIVVKFELELKEVQQNV